jgi:hypothetical protein
LPRLESWAPSAHTAQRIRQIPQKAFAQQREPFLYPSEEAGMVSKVVHVLLVDPDEHTAGNLLNAFRQRWPHYPITIVQDGVAALHLLRCTNQARGTPSPQLILLNLSRSPAASGLPFLQELRGDPILRRRPVFVLGHSSQEADILAVYDFLVAGYVVWTDVAGDPQRLVNLLDAYFNAVEFCEV